MITLENSYVRRLVFAALGLLSFQSASPQVWALADPGALGPLSVTSKIYSGKDILLSGFPGSVEVNAIVWHPIIMSGVYPLVIFLHGKHSTCYKRTQVAFGYPCPIGYKPIPSYLGYDYLAKSLASNGYIVVSISANGINAKDDTALDMDGGALARAKLIQYHLDTWRSFNNGGDPFGGIFRGHVNLNNIGTMGHSRGGEGVVRHFLYNASLGTPYGIKAVLPLAPVNFKRLVINRVPLGVLLPYCDGDVSDLSGVHYYDDARYNVPSDPAPKHTFLVMGANHNYYNTVWTNGLFPAGGGDDWFYPGPTGAWTDPHCGRFGPGSRLTASQQQSTALAYVKAFFRSYLGGRTDLMPYLKSDAPPPPSAQTGRVYASYHAAASQRRTVNSMLGSANLTTNNLGGQIRRIGITPYGLCGGPAPQLLCFPAGPLVKGSQIQRQPHSTLLPPPGLSQLMLGWLNPSASYTNVIPLASGNVSSLTNLQFRAAVNFASNLNRLGAVQDFSIVLTDTSGRAARVRVGAYSQALFYPPGSGTAVYTPKVVLNTVRIPLSAFTSVNKSSIKELKFEFNQRSSGNLLISDIAFAK